MPCFQAESVQTAATARVAPKPANPDVLITMPDRLNTQPMGWDQGGTG